MSNKVKDISIKNQTYSFFDDIINIKIFDPNNKFKWKLKLNKLDEKSYNNILIYNVGYVMIKDIEICKS